MLHARTFPTDEYGCGFYRMRLPAEHVSREGVLVDERRRVERWSNGRVGTDGADVFVFQRPMDPRVVEVIRSLHRQGVAVVVELDDDMCAMDPHHISYRACHPRFSPRMNWKHLRQACGLADLVTTTTPELAERYAAHGRVAVLPNYVPGRLLDHNPEPDVDLTWMAELPSHPHDPQVTGTAIRDLVADGYSFRVANAVGLKDALALDADPDETGWLDLDGYYNALGRARLSIVPLADSAFNRGKSWLKGLESAALGVPFVASPTPDYRRLVDLLGLDPDVHLASKPRHWRTRIPRAVESGRARVAEELTIERNAWRWAEAWQTAVDNRQARGRRAA